MTDSIQKIIEEMRYWTGWETRLRRHPFDKIVDWASRLEALQGEPVAVVEDWPDDKTRIGIVPLRKLDATDIGTKLYAAPPQADGVVVQREHRYINQDIFIKVKP